MIKPNEIQAKSMVELKAIAFDLSEVITYYKEIQAAVTKEIQLRRAQEAKAALPPKEDTPQALKIVGSADADGQG